MNVHVLQSVSFLEAVVDSSVLFEGTADGVGQPEGCCGNAREDNRDHYPTERAAILYTRQKGEGDAPTVRRRARLCTGSEGVASGTSEGSLYSSFQVL